MEMPESPSVKRLIINGLTFGVILTIILLVLSVGYSYVHKQQLYPSTLAEATPMVLVSLLGGIAFYAIVEYSYLKHMVCDRFDRELKKY